MKKVLATMTFLITAAAVTLSGATATAADGDTQVIDLKGTGSSFNESWNNTFAVGGAENASNPSMWHLVYTGNNPADVTEMQLTFADGTVFDWTPALGFSTNNGGNNPGWVILAPAGWEIASGFLITKDLTQVNFNISGFNKGVPDKPVNGALTFEFDITAQHKEVTTQEVRQKTIQPIWQTTIQRYERPVFYQPKTTYNNNTLVTRLDYSSNLASAVPTNGVTLNNGHTVVAVNIAAASAPEGVSVEIADSSFNANGKKTPAEYNSPIGYSYNVQIANGQVTISFDDSLVSASVGVEASAYNKECKNKNDTNCVGANAPAHFANSVTVDLPKGASDIVYLYVHIESISWLPGGPDFWKFDRWVVDPNLTVVTEAWVRNEIVDDQLLRTKVTEKMINDGPYTGDLLLEVSGPMGVVYSGAPKDLTDLAPGSYIATLSSPDDAFVAIPVTVTVESGKTTVVDFGSIVVTGDTEYINAKAIYVRPIILDRAYLAPIELDVIQLGNDFDAFDPWAIRR
ncbi:MAG: hypothetical protein LBE83_03720 [Propionibacteriaceae bacterium]|jgi:hypothetical protein|nr:hypothetical protein [Propionibacteriaceae bacterium]